MAGKVKEGKGRPTVFTESVLLKLEEAFALGCTDLEACLYAGITKTPFYNYQNENPDFKDRKELLKNTPILKARTSVITALQGDPDLALKFLERKKKDEFSLRSEVTGADGDKLEAIQTVFVPVGKDYDPSATN